MMKIIEERQGPTLSVVLKSVALVGEKTRSPSRTDGPDGPGKMGKMQPLPHWAF